MSKPGVTADDLRRIRSHRLQDDLVRTALAGYLHQELRTFYGIAINPIELYAAITKYVQAVSTSTDFEKAVKLQKEGARPRGWPEGYPESNKGDKNK